MKRQLKPSDIKDIHPWNSVDQRNETESHMHWFVHKLAENGDTFRKLSFEEYEKHGGKDSKETVDHFNRYTASADTIVLYSPAYQEVADKL